MPSRRLKEYLASLPDGLRSYPECTAKAALLHGVGVMFDAQALKDLPPELTARLSQDLLPTEWVPEVEHMALFLYGYENRVTTPSEERELWEQVAQLNVGLFNRPEYQPMIAKGDPRRLLKQVGARWHRFHRGTDLSVLEIDDGFARLELRYPRNLFPPVTLRMRTATLRGALLACEVQEAEVYVEEVEEERAVFVAKWTRRPGSETDSGAS